MSARFRVVMQLIHNLETGPVKVMKAVPDGEERSSSSLRLEQLKMMGLADVPLEIEEIFFLSCSNVDDVILVSLHFFESFPII